MGAVAEHSNKRDAETAAGDDAVVDLTRPDDAHAAKRGRAGSPTLRHSAGDEAHGSASASSSHAPSANNELGPVMPAEVADAMRLYGARRAEADSAVDNDDLFEPDEQTAAAPATPLGRTAWDIALEADSEDDYIRTADGEEHGPARNGVGHRETVADDEL